jgi:predicted methyltransferase
MARAAAMATGILLASALGLAAANGQRAIPPYISAAVADSARPEADSKRDADRKPAETLAFAGVRPGDHVVELAPGRGYFTRLLSAVVGPQGRLTAVASPKRPDAAPDAPAPASFVQAIAADPHYANVTVSEQRALDFALPEGSADVVWTSQNYHDFHNVPGLDVLNLDKAVLKALKPGGTYIVLDHAAEPGSGFRDTNTLHRVDPEAVKKEVLAAGFRLEGEGGVLRNRDDPHTAKVFDPAIRGHTDQFILKFSKPR